MRQFWFNRLIVSLVLVGVLLDYVIMSSHAIHLVDVKEHLTNTPWPTCASVPYSMKVHCDPTQDPFSTTTTWHSRTPHPEK